MKIKFGKKCLFEFSVFAMMAKPKHRKTKVRENRAFALYLYLITVITSVNIFVLHSFIQKMSLYFEGTHPNLTEKAKLSCKFFYQQESKRLAIGVCSNWLFSSQSPKVILGFSSFFNGESQVCGKFAWFANK